MKGNNFFHRVTHSSDATPFVALAPVTLNSGATASANGNTIKEPWKKGRQLSFIAILGAIAAGSVLSLKVQGQKRSDDTWATLKEADGVTDLIFTATGLADNDDGKGVIGTLDLTRIDGTTYKAIRVLAANAAAFDALIGVAYVIFDLLRHPSGTVDDLFYKQTNSGTPA